MTGESTPSRAGTRVSCGGAVLRRIGTGIDRAKDTTERQSMRQQGTTAPFLVQVTVDPGGATTVVLWGGGEFEE